MAYSRSPYTLRRIEVQLEPLTRGETCIYTKPEGASANWASQWSYKIREGLSIARALPDRFPSLAKVAANVEVRVLSSQEVEARVNVRVPALPVIGGGNILHNYTTSPMDNLEQVKVEWEGQGTAHYALTAFSQEEIRNLAAWGRAQEPPLMVLYSPRTTALTLAIDDPSVPEEAKVRP